MAYQEPLPKDTLLLDEFKIVGLLGTGGFANTYLAHDSSLGREVAIKEYFPSELAIRVPGSTRVEFKSSAQEAQFNWALRRFVREAQTLAKFRHPSVVRVFRVFRSNNTAYMVLEFIHGSDMEAWLKQIARPPTQTELDHLLPPLLDALDVVHGAGILHRDIKPANVYIRASDQQPVLLDFGAARFASSSEFASKTAAIVSKGYSPHEAYSTDSQLQGPWTDIYGMAATIYRSLAGRPPPESTMRALEDRCVPATQLSIATEYRPDFLQALDHALAVMPKDRPQSIHEWRRRLLPNSPSTPRANPNAADPTTMLAWRPISLPPSHSRSLPKQTLETTRRPASDAPAPAAAEPRAPEPTSAPATRDRSMPSGRATQPGAVAAPQRSAGSHRTLLIGLVLFVFGGVALAAAWLSNRPPELAVTGPEPSPGTSIRPGATQTDTSAQSAREQARVQEENARKERELAETERRKRDAARAAAEQKKRDEEAARASTEARPAPGTNAPAVETEDEARARAWADRKAREEFMSKRQGAGGSQ
ncbi:MAG: protein kinase [Hyphomicrobiaceae bacterium]|nr:protein kinase [Hyphomicrobiaceae bacterium]